MRASGSVFLFNLQNNKERQRAEPGWYGPTCICCTERYFHDICKVQLSSETLGTSDATLQWVRVARSCFLVHRLPG